SRAPLPAARLPRAPLEHEQRRGRQVEPPAELAADGTGGARGGGACRRGPLAAAAAADVGLAVVEEVGEHDAPADAVDAGALGEHDGRVSGDVEAGAVELRRARAREHPPAGLDQERRAAGRLLEPAKRGEDEQEERHVLGGHERAGQVRAEASKTVAVALARYQEWKGAARRRAEHDRTSPARRDELDGVLERQRLEAVEARDGGV